MKMSAFDAVKVGDKVVIRKAFNDQARDAVVDHVSSRTFRAGGITFNLSGCVRGGKYASTYATPKA